MNRKYSISFAAFVFALLATSCRPSYEVTHVEGTTIPVDTTWDAAPDAEAVALLAPYKAKVDSMMQHVVGQAAVDMDRYRPESPLSNLVADVLRQAAVPVIGREADMGLVNMGGIRAPLSHGAVTTADIYEILPFENSLCVLTLKGSVLRSLMGDIARRGGEGVSGVSLTISRDGKLLNATVGGRSIEDERLYTVASIDYLADGNDGMYSLLGADARQCPPDATLRSLFMNYVEQQTAQGKALTSGTEGRITVKE